MKAEQILRVNLGEIRYQRPCNVASHWRHKISNAQNTTSFWLVVVVHFKLPYVFREKKDSMQWPFVIVAWWPVMNFRVINMSLFMIIFFSFLYLHSAVSYIIRSSYAINGNIIVSISPLKWDRKRETRVIIAPSIAMHSINLCSTEKLTRTDFALER